MKISFDFDRTFYKLKDIAKKLDKSKYDIWIVTKRFEKDDNSDLFKLAKYANIKNIHFTNGEYKADYLEKNNFDLHIDDNVEELKRIKPTKVKGIIVDEFVEKMKTKSIESLLECNKNMILNFEQFVNESLDHKSKTKFNH